MRSIDITPAIVLVVAALVGCGGPPVTPPDAATSDAGTIDAATSDAAMIDAGMIDAAPIDGGPDACMPFPGDYTPRIAMSSTDEWAPCISDLGAYARIEPTISSIARVEAFDALVAPGGFLAGADRDPTLAELTEGRTVYETDQGLGSRVIRRSDEHVAAPEPSDCRLGSVVSASPEYCVGPTQLAPIVRESFAAAMSGGPEPSRVYAARIDAALTFFLYLSPLKETLTCTSTARDCDSAWAYYTGGVESREGGIGLARLVRGLDRETHDRIWDALLAVRCWRDLDPDAVATDVELRDRAITQLDRALDRGLALVIADRLRRLQATTGDERRAHLEWLQTIAAPIASRTIPSPDPGGADITVPARASLVDRMLRARSPEIADRFATELTTTDPAAVDVDTLVELLESIFPCA